MNYFKNYLELGGKETKKKGGVGAREVLAEKN